VLFRFSINVKLLLISLVFFFVNLFVAFDISLLKHVFKTCESLANAPEKM